jgi:phage shock protein PspC (stress-responsive transcriptional regulator)
MKKVININLGGLPYIIDEDAYEFLNRYLDSIRRHFSRLEGCDEILYDIELRMSELFQENLKVKQIISTADLNLVIEVLGKPEEFGAEAIEEDYDTSYTDKTKSSTSYSDSFQFSRTGKRLFRDMDQKVVGGVCSGLSNYLGIEDPVWIRLCMGLLALSGVGVGVYIFAWIIIPQAKTSADKLAMKGEPINIENIAKTVETELHELSDTIKNMSSSFGKKKVDDEPNSTSNFSKNSGKMSFAATMLTPFRWLFSLIGWIWNSVYLVLKGVTKVTASTTIIVLLLSLVVFFISILIAAYFGMDALFFFGTDSVLTNILAAIVIPLVIMIPTMGAILFMSRWFYPRKETSYGRWLAMGWFAALVVTTALGLKGFGEYKTGYSDSKVTSYPVNTSKQLVVDMAGDDYVQDGVVHFGNSILRDGNKWRVWSNGIRFEKTDDDKLTIQTEVKARGDDGSDAKLNANSIAEMMTINGNKITIDPYLTYEDGKKYRGEAVKYIISVPKNMEIALKKTRRMGNVTWGDNFTVENMQENYQIYR